MSIERAITQLRRSPLTMTALTSARQTAIENGINPIDIDLALVFMKQGNVDLASKYIFGPVPARASPGAIATLEMARDR